MRGWDDFDLVDSIPPLHPDEEMSTLLKERADAFLADHPILSDKTGL